MMNPYTDNIADDMSESMRYYPKDETISRDHAEPGEQQ